MSQKSLSAGLLQRARSTNTETSKATMKSERGDTAVLPEHASWSTPPLAFRRSPISDGESKKNKYYPSVTPLPVQQNRRIPRRQPMRPSHSSVSSSAKASAAALGETRSSPVRSEQQRGWKLTPAAQQVARDKIALSISKHFPEKRDREKLAQILQSKRSIQQESLSKASTQESSSKQLTREEIAISIMQRFPEESDLEKVIRLLQARQGSVGKTTSTKMQEPWNSSPKQRSREEVAASIAKRFPNDLEKVVRFLKSQQDTFKNLKRGEEDVVTSTMQPLTRRSASPPAAAAARSSDAATGEEGLSIAMSRDKEVKSVASRFPERRDRERVATFVPSQQRALQTNNPYRNEVRSPKPSSTKKSGRFHGGADAGVCQPAVPRRVPVCQCCYEDIHTAPVVRCSIGAHSFCPSCIKRYVETWVYGEPYPIKDIPDKADGSFKALPCLSGSCTEGYIPHNAVQGTNSEHVWESYQEKMFHAMSLKDDVTPSTKPAPKSLAQAGSDEVTEEESVSSSMDQGYRAVEEAMTEAKLRRCPECHTPFLKESGYCNKIRCPSCRTAVCYICRQKVENRGYKHFCVHSYDSCNQNCGKCSLWTNKDDKVDQERLRLVATNEANRMWEESLLGDDSSTVVELDVERLLQQPGTRKAAAKK